MRTSSLLKVHNESLALAIDIAATARLKVYDEDKEAKMIEALVTGSANSSLNAIATGLSKSPPSKASMKNLPRQ